MKLDMLVVVSSEDSAALLTPLLQAATRASCKTSVFFTNDGVRLASDPQLAKALSDCEQAVVCADSWTRYMPDASCPMTSGSQTDHSRMAGEAGRVVSL